MFSLTNALRGIRNDSHVRMKYLGGTLIFLIALINYCMSMAPTTSFWDCGEFIACSVTQGVPHPPGTPLFILIGRVFAMVRFFEEVAVQINFISALSSALAVLFIYAVVVRSVEYWTKAAQPLVRTAASVGGGFSGALALTFSDTFWFNAVEAEVYAAAMLIMMLCTWLTMVWSDRREEPGSERLLILIMYILFLAAGIHILAMLVIPPIMLLVIMRDKDMRTNWKPYVIGVALSMVIYMLTEFLFLVYAFSVILYLRVVLSKRTWSPLFSTFIGLVLLFTGYKMYAFIAADADPKAFAQFVTFLSGIFLIVFTLMVFTTKEHKRYNSNFWFWVVFLCMVGYAPQAYIPIRSAMNPNIDENNPENWTNFQSFLERKQYGQESMVEAMFKRRTTWKEQFGMNPHCGFWRFFRQQYIYNIPSLPWFLQPWWIPILIGLVGFWYQWKRHRTSAQLFTILFVLSSVGLLLYINFKQDEVRIRDYFYTPAFLYFAYWIGIGMAGIIHFTAERATRLRGALRPALIWTVTAVCMVLPAVPVLATASFDDERDIYFVHDRSRNFIPWDYAYNILNSCEQGGIIFTNGDNDTFPLWFLQEVMKVRTDVKVVNLSLLNTPWYIKQLRDLEPKIDIRFSDDFIDRRLMPQRIPRAGKLDAGGIPVELKKGQIFRVQDWMIIEIIKAVKWTKPIYFAVTVSNSNKLGMDPYLTMEGLAFRLYPEKVTTNLDIEKTRHNLYEVYKYRGLTDPTVYKNPNTQKLISNYNAAYFQLAIKYSNELKQPDEAIATLMRADSLVGIGWRGHYLLSEIQTTARRFDKAVENLAKVVPHRPTDIGVRMRMGALYEQTGNTDSAAAAYEAALNIKPNVRQAYQALERLYVRAQRFGDVAGVLERWQQIDPDDAKLGQRLRAYRAREEQQQKNPPAAAAPGDSG